MSALRIVIAGMAMAAALPSQAADRGFYFGVLGGRADYEFSAPDIAIATFAPEGFFVPGTPIEGPVAGVVNPLPIVSVAEAQFGFADPSADDSDTAWGATVGYRIFDYAAVELSYVDLGSLQAHDELNLFFIPGAEGVVLNQEVKTAGPSISVLGMMPVAERWDLYLRVGVLFADQEHRQSFSGGQGVIFGAPTRTTYGSDTALWGGGVQFNWPARWSVRLDFQRYDDVGSDTPIGESDIDLISLGVLYRL